MQCAFSPKMSDRQTIRRAGVAKGQSFAGGKSPVRLKFFQN
jgi:hypothetical protein